MELTDREKFDLAKARKDVESKLAALPDRQKDEFQHAEADDREPVMIEPLTPIRAPLLGKLLESIGEPGEDLQEIVKVQKRAVRVVGNAYLNLLSSQLKQILDAAKLDEPPPAPAEG